MPFIFDIRIVENISIFIINAAKREPFKLGPPRADTSTYYLYLITFYYIKRENDE